jgi:hypothetical protein
MNEGRYPDKVVNEAVELVNEGETPKDVADVLHLKYGYAGLHAKTVANWHRKYPLGKSPKTLPPRVVDEIRQVVRDLGQRERKKPCLQHVFIREIIDDDSPKTVATSRTEKMSEVKRCRLCGFEERRSRFLQIN